MATNKVFINYTETYDLNTVKDKLTLIGIHTPTKVSLLKVCKGLFENFRSMKIHSCDVALACASQLPMDPLGIGTEPGMVAPQDVMNPILFKPITGEKLNPIVESVYTGSDDHSITEKKFVTNSVYYNLLSDTSFRKSHPQMGLVANGLVPLVHDLATLRPITSAANKSDLLGSESGLPQISGDAAAILRNFGDTFINTISGSSSISVATTGAPTQFITTGARPLPSLPTMSSNPTADTVDSMVPFIPKVYCGVIVMPPAVLQSLYYRIQITWHIGFYGFRPSFDSGAIISMLDNEALYSERYETPAGATAASMMSEEGSLDTIGVENIQMVNASVS